MLRIDPLSLLLQPVTVNGWDQRWREVLPSVKEALCWAEPAGGVLKDVRKSERRNDLGGMIEGIEVLHGNNGRKITFKRI